MTSASPQSTPVTDSFGSGDHWYALMEGAHPDHNIPRLICSHRRDPQWLALYDAGAFQSIATHGPYLLKVDHPDEWLALWQATFPDVAGSFLRSPASLPTVAAHLRTLISVRVEGGGEALFRFHDGWVLGSLYPALSPVERQQLHGPVTDWRWLQGDQMIPSDSLSGTGSGVPVEDGWLVLDQRKREAIQQGMVARTNAKEVGHG